jgi:hypothetical protein
MQTENNTTDSELPQVVITLSAEEAATICAALVQAQLRAYKLAQRSGVRSRCGRNTSEDHYAEADFLKALHFKIQAANTPQKSAAPERVA